MEKEKKKSFQMVQNALWRANATTEIHTNYQVTLSVL